MTLVKVVDLGPGVFQGAKNETMLLFFVSGSARSDAVVDVFRTNPKLFPEHTQYFAPRQQDWVNKDGTPWLVHGSDESAKFMNSMRRAKHKLGDLTTINQGLRTGDNDNFLASRPKNSKWKLCAGGKQIGRFESKRWARGTL